MVILINKCLFLGGFERLGAGAHEQLGELEHRLGGVAALLLVT